MKTIKLFISSPGDVAQEREICRRVIVRLNREFSGRVQLDGYFWEYEPMEITHDYQEQIPPPSSFDIFVCILWSRLGSRLHSRYQLPDGRPCRSGTEFEFVDAVEGRKRNDGSPEILVWVNKTQPMIPLEPEKEYEQRIQQWRLLKTFLDEWTRDDDEGVFKGAVNSYRRLDKFEEMAEIKLRKLVERRLGDTSSDDTLPVVQWKQGSPYRGLEAFSKEHADVFFGRTAAIENVLNAIRRQTEAGSGFVLVLGASGSGKSSLVFAGVLPLLTTPGVIEGIGLWREATMRPGHHGGDLLARLAAALLDDKALPELADPEWTDPLTELAGKFEKQPEATAGSVRLVLNEAARAYQNQQDDRLRERCRQLEAANRQEDAAAISKRIGDRKPPRARLVLVLDQFEELFTGNASSEQRQQFVTVFAELARCNRVVILTTLRSDFYHHFQETPGLIELPGESGKVDVLAPQAHEVGQIIREPARMAGLVFEKEVATGETLDEVLRDAALDHPEALPLLEHALDQLYDCQVKRGDRVLRFADYEEIGKLDGALARHADAAFAELNPTSRASFDQVFRALVTLGREDHIPVRRTALLSRLTKDEGAEALVKAFVEQRLFTTDQLSSGEAVVSVAHEALLRSWGRASEWIAANEDFLAIRSRVTAACAQWQTSSNDPSFLLQAGRQLAEAEDGLNRHPDAFSNEEQAFIKASQERLTEVEHRARRRRTIIMASMAVLTAIAVYGFFDAQHRRKLEAQATQRAETTVEAAQSFLGALLGPDEWSRRLQEKDSTLAAEFLASSSEFVSKLGEKDQTVPILEDWAIAKRALTSTLMNQGKSEEALEVQASALFIQQGLVEHEPDNPIRHAHLAAQWYLMGQLFIMSGDPTNALKAYAKGLEKVEEIMPRLDSDRLREEWLSLQNALARTETQHGDKEQGDARVARTVAKLTEWADAGVGERDWAALLVDTWIRQADAAVMINTYDQAESALRNAEVAMKRVTQEDQRRASQEKLLESWGFLETYRKDFAKASAHYRELLNTLDASPNPNDAVALERRCVLLGSLIQSLTNEGKTEEAIAKAQESLGFAETLAAIDEVNVAYQKPRCNALGSLAWLTELRSDWKASEEWYGKAYQCMERLTELVPDGHNSASLLDYANGRSRAFANLKQFGYGLQAVEKAIPYTSKLEALIDAPEKHPSAGLWKRQLATFQAQLAYSYGSQLPPKLEEAKGAFRSAIKWSDGLELLAPMRETWIQQLNQLESTPAVEAP